VGGTSPLHHYRHTFFDGLGRNYWSVGTGPEGKDIVVEARYDRLGRVEHKSNPHFYGVENPFWTSIEYDGFSRVKRTRTPDGYSTSTSYQGLKRSLRTRIINHNLYP